MKYNLVVNDEELAEALSALETAAWGRRWRDVQVCRQRILQLTGVKIEGRLRKQIEQAVAASSSETEDPR